MRKARAHRIAAKFHSGRTVAHVIRSPAIGRPKLEGLFGRPAGSISDFQQYTPELKTSGIVWTDETLDAYLSDPNKLVPGTTMAAFGRVADAKDRKELIAYMRREDRSFELCPKS